MRSVKSVPNGGQVLFRGSWPLVLHVAPVVALFAVVITVSIEGTKLWQLGSVGFASMLLSWAVANFAFRSSFTQTGIESRSFFASKISTSALAGLELRHGYSIGKISFGDFGGVVTVLLIDGTSFDLPGTARLTRPHFEELFEWASGHNVPTSRQFEMQPVGFWRSINTLFTLSKTK